MEKDFSKLYNNLVSGLYTYCKSNNLQSFVLGISGGIDSTITAAIASKAADLAGVTIYGVSMPTITNDDDETSTAELVGNAFCDEFVEQPIGRLYSSVEVVCANLTYRLANKLDGSTKIAKGNIKARLRMITLYHIASMTGGVVLDTDNATEHFTGFYTIHGDDGDIGVLRDLDKSTIFAFAEWMMSNSKLFNEMQREAIAASRKLNPTDGNGVGCDLEQFGLPTYAEVDAVVNGTETENVGNVMSLHNKTWYKRQVRPLYVNEGGNVVQGDGSPINKEA